MISARQIKAARALLDWSQEDLATNTALSVATIRNIESRDRLPRNTTAKIIFNTFKNAGLEFIENDGIKRSSRSVVIFQGADAFDKFLDDVTETIREKGGEIVSAFKSVEALSRSSDLTRGNIERFKALTEKAVVKCLLPASPTPMSYASAFSFRVLPEDLIGPCSYFIYGDKHAIVLIEGTFSISFVVINSLNLAQSYKKEFYKLWDRAFPLGRVASENPRANV